MEYLLPLDSVKEMFLEHFGMRMNVAAACLFHENKLLFETNDETSVFDDSQNKNPAVINSYVEAEVFGNAEKSLDSVRLNPRKRTVQFHTRRKRNMQIKIALTCRR